MLIFFKDKNESMNMSESDKTIKEMIDNIYLKLNNRNLEKFAGIIASPRKIFWRSFLAGIARGIGTAIGFSILSAILIYILRYIVMLNLPVIGAFIKDVLEIVQNQ